MAFEFKNLKGMAKWLRRNSVEAGALSGNKLDRQFYKGQEQSFRLLAEMIEKEEIVLSSEVRPIKDAQVDKDAEDAYKKEKLKVSFCNWCDDHE